MKIAFSNFLDCIEEKRISSRVSFNIFHTFLNVILRTFVLI